MARTFLCILVFATMLTPLAAAEDEPEPAEAGPEATSSEPSESSADAPEEKDACGLIENGDKTWDNLPVAPDGGGTNGFIGIFVGTQRADGGFSGSSIGVNTQCVEPDPIIHEILCLTDFTCQLQLEP